MTAPRHTNEQFVGFLGDVLDGQPEGREIHVIRDNVSSHKTELVQCFLAQHTNVQIHYTPTYSSRLNQVENWFSRIQRDVISRGIFTSVKDLDRKLRIAIKATTRPAPRLTLSPAPEHWQPRQLSIAFETPALLGPAAEQRIATVRALAELLLRAAGVQLTEVDDGEQ